MKIRLLQRLMIGLALATAPAAQNFGPAALPDVDWEQRMGAQVPLDTPFFDEDGQEILLGEFVRERPVILALVYYECPMLCGLVLSGLSRDLKGVPFAVGEEFDVVAVSIDHEETPALARAKKGHVVEAYSSDDDGSGWHFLTGSADSVRAVAEAVGFGYTYVPETDEYAHAAGVTLLTPQGKVSHYFYGHEYASRDLRLALVESSEGKIGSPVEKFLLRCFSYDPSQGKYGFAIMTAIRTGGLLTVACIVVFVLRNLLREKRQRRLPATGRPALEDAAR